MQLELILIGRFGFPCPKCERKPSEADMSREKHCRLIVNDSSRVAEGLSVIGFSDAEGYTSQPATCVVHDDQS